MMRLIPEGGDRGDSAEHVPGAAKRGRTDEEKTSVPYFFQENMYVSPKNIQLVAETNQALSHIMTLHLEEGGLRDSGGAGGTRQRQHFPQQGINLVTVPMEPDGMDLAKLETTIRKYAPKFIYTMPNYHNPTGIVMSLENWKKLLELAGRYCIPIIEEDSPAGFSLRRKPASQPVRSRIGTGR